MRNPRVYGWSLSDDTIGLLYFAQRLEECLFDYTLDSYKAPALNSHTRALELLRTLDDVRAGTIMPKTLGPIATELAHSIRGDPAARFLLRDVINDVTDETWWSTSDHARLLTQAQLVRGRLWRRAYERELRRQLLEFIPEGKRKEDISRLTVDLAVEWMRMEYSRDYVFYRTRTFFFGVRTKIDEARSALEQFFSFFELKNRKFDVCFRAGQALEALKEVVPSEFAEIAGVAPASRASLPKELTFLNHNHAGVWVTVRQVEALDARSARDSAAQRLENLSTLVYYHIHRRPMDWSGEALVWDANHPVVLRESRQSIHKGDECDSTELATRLASTLQRLGPNIGPDWRRIRAALGLHASAITSRDPAVQLTTLWAAIEALCQPSFDEARIVRITDILVPLLASRYPEKMFGELFESLRSCCRHELTQALTGVLPNELTFLRCAAIVTIESYEDRRNILYNALGKNPLLRHRLFELHKSFRTATAIRQTLRDHSQRLEWHVRRIYRNRNLHIHSGTGLPYREALVENVHAYFHRILNSLERSFGRRPSPVSLEAAFLEEKLHHQRHLMILERTKDASVDEQSIRQLLLGDTGAAEAA